MKKYFITGLVLLLPITLTFVIVMFVFNILTEPFVGAMEGFFNYYGLLQNGGEQVRVAISRIAILILLFFFTVLLGIITRLLFIHYIIRFGDYILHRIPIVRSIYKTCQDVINTLFTTDTHSFKQVVLVPFPNRDTLSVGLVTREGIGALPGKLSGEHIAVFVPTTPNPTSGFLMLFPHTDLTYLDMSIEDAFKYVISCGVIEPHFHALEKSDAKRLQMQREQEDNS